MLMLAHRVFRTKAAARQAIQVILQSTPIGTTLPPKDYDVVRSLIDHHQSADAKIGCGISSIQVEQNKYNTKGFWITRIDGSRDSFSYLECLNPSTLKAKANNAFRQEIDPDIRSLKISAFNAGAQYCAVSGVLLTIDTCHVDHEPKFRILVSDFLLRKNLTFDDIRTYETDKTGGELLVDRNLANEWIEYHRSHAHLRLVSRAVNLSLK